MKQSFLFVLGLALFACSPSPQKKVEDLQHEVIALHDSAMAKMGALYNGRKELTYLRDSVVVQDTAAQRQLSHQIEKLVQADEAMMQWMRAYRNPDGQQPNAALPYLQQEKVKIEQVRQDIDLSLKTADSLALVYRTPKP